MTAQEVLDFLLQKQKEGVELENIDFCFIRELDQCILSFRTIEFEPSHAAIVVEQ